MLENFKKVDNPLTVISIFAGVAEVAMSAVAIFNTTLGGIFIWFVIGFPVLLVVLFFLTLNLNHKVLYAPSDFRDDKAFLDLARPAIVAEIELSNAVDQLEKLAPASAQQTSTSDQADDADLDRTPQLVDVKLLQEVMTDLVAARDRIRDEEPQAFTTFLHRLGLSMGELAYLKEMQKVIARQPGVSEVSPLELRRFPEHLRPRYLHSLMDKGYIEPAHCPGGTGQPVSYVMTSKALRVLQGE